MWQALASIASLIGALAAGGVGVAAFVRSARAGDAKERADATGVGLDYLEKALAAQQVTITRQSGEIGEVRGQLVDCRNERQTMADQLTTQADQIADLRRRIQ